MPLTKAAGSREVRRSWSGPRTAGPSSSSTARSWCRPHVLGRNSFRRAAAVADSQNSRTASGEAEAEAVGVRAALQRRDQVDVALSSRAPPSVRHTTAHSSLLARPRPRPGEGLVGQPLARLERTAQVTAPRHPRTSTIPSRPFLDGELISRPGQAPPWPEHVFEPGDRHFRVSKYDGRARSAPWCLVLFLRRRPTSSFECTFRS